MENRIGAMVIKADPSPLISRCLRGDPHAWEDFLRDYGRLIWSTAHRCGATGDEAEEVFQRSWVAIVEGLGKLKNRKGLVSWIVSLTRHQTWRLFEEKKRHRRHLPMESVEEMDGRTDSPAVQETELLGEESGILIHQALDQLSDSCRQLVEMLFFKDPRPGYREISEELGIAVGSIGPIRARCLARLKKYYFALYHQTRKEDS